MTDARETLRATTLLPTTTERIVLPRSGRVIDVPKATPAFASWRGVPIPNTYGRKPVLDVDGEPCFAEIATLRALEGVGWEGVWIDSFEEPEALVASVDRINDLAVIAINFPKFIDGRGFSLGRLLRERYGFRNELRAIGDVLRDQIFFFKRCGFDAYKLRADRDMQDALDSLRDFSDPYQGAVDEPRPLFRRVERSAA